MDFVLIANAWGAGVDNPTSKHRIALELSRRGHRVLWVEGAGMRTPSLSSGSDRGRILRKLRQAAAGAREAVAPSGTDGGIWVLTPLSVPLPRYEAARRLNGWLYASASRRACRSLGFIDATLFNYVPVLAEAMRHWRRGKTGGRRLETGDRRKSAVPSPQSAVLSHSRVVYHCVDRWDAFDMYDSAMMANMDARCCRYAGVVLASSNDLLERCREKNENSHLVMHGVDFEHFRNAESGLRNAERPSDLPGGPIVGFFGLLSEWLDQDLLLATADRVADSASLVLIGTADVDVSRLRGVPNIHLLGPKPFAELPAYIAHFQLGIIPFAINELTVAVNPIKLREMLAAGCPVVSTPLPEVVKYSECGVPNAECRTGVRTARSAGGFVDAVLAALSSPFTHEQRLALSETMRGETWSHKVDEILHAIASPGGEA